MAKKSASGAKKKKSAAKNPKAADKKINVKKGNRKTSVPRKDVKAAVQKVAKKAKPEKTLDYKAILEMQFPVANFNADVLKHELKKSKAGAIKSISAKLGLEYKSVKVTLPEINALIDEYYVGELAESVADVNQDGKVDGKDAAIVAKALSDSGKQLTEREAMDIEAKSLGLAHKGIKDAQLRVLIDQVKAANATITPEAAAAVKSATKGEKKPSDDDREGNADDLDRVSGDNIDAAIANAPSSPSETPASPHNFTAAPVSQQTPSAVVQPPERDPNWKPKQASDDFPDPIQVNPLLANENANPSVFAAATPITIDQGKMNDYAAALEGTIKNRPLAHLRNISMKDLRNMLDTPNYPFTYSIVPQKGGTNQYEIILNLGDIKSRIPTAAHLWLGVD